MLLWGLGRPLDWEILVNDFFRLSMCMIDCFTQHTGNRLGHLAKLHCQICSKNAKQSGEVVDYKNEVRAKSLWEDGSRWPARDDLFTYFLESARLAVLRYKGVVKNRFYDSLSSMLRQAQHQELSDSEQQAAGASLSQRAREQIWLNFCVFHVNP